MVQYNHSLERFDITSDHSDRNSTLILLVIMLKYKYTLNKLYDKHTIVQYDHSLDRFTSTSDHFLIEIRP